MSDLNDLTIRYIAAWNEPDADARARAVAALWTEDGSYTEEEAEAAASFFAGVWGFSDWGSSPDTCCSL